MVIIVCCFFLLLAITGGVHSQSADNTQGFVSIDCGYTGDNYTDAVTGLVYTSDADYTEGGVPRDVSKDYIDTRWPVQQLSTVRSFPDGARNCYTIPNLLTKGAKYLIRASFLYGNHDGLNSQQVSFLLYLGVNIWGRIQLPSPKFWLHTELLFVAESSSISVCLVRLSNSGTAPFISSLELRPLPNSIYPAAVDASNWLILDNRKNIGPPAATGPTVRYPDDLYDRIWDPFLNIAKWSNISTTSVVKDPQSNGGFLVPSKVLQTAAVPAGNATNLEFPWMPVTASDGTVAKYHIFLHFAGIGQSNGEQRIFNITLNGDLFNGPNSLGYLVTLHVSTNNAVDKTNYDLNIIMDGTTSTLPPILSGLETYWIMKRNESATDEAEADAIMDIKRLYNLKRNWMGDPCAPQAYAWDGLNCTYAASASPTITALNLSSSNLTGEIPASLANLKELTTLDLSMNGFSGEIPDFLGDMTSLKHLNLTENDLTGSIPSALLQRSKEGSLTLSFEGNRGLCTSDNPCSRKKKKWIIIVVICLIVALLLAVGILIVFYLRKVRRKNQQGNYSKDEKFRQQTDNEDTSVSFGYRQFTYSELQTITKNFQVKLGEGGFGNVYCGTLENDYQVAVKIRHQSSSQGVAQLITEVNLLSGIHHKNLVSLRGYCNEKINRGDKKKRDHTEENCLALVYEYMSKGNLEEYLRDKELCWRERLQIAVDAAEGLDYLHRSCNPPIVHRDVKTSNILLDDKLHAKLADFGLSTRACKTAIVGTIGYLDPAHQSSSELTLKSDVYSFGVVLLELITGRPAAERQHEGGTIVKLTEWARPRIEQRAIAVLADARLKATGGGCSVSSFWKAVDVAVECIETSPTRRPDMAIVVVQLSEALKLEEGDHERRPKFVSALGEASKLEVGNNEGRPRCVTAEGEALKLEVGNNEGRPRFVTAEGDD